MTGIGERINARRKELGMTQEELSKKLGYKNKSTISQIENGVNDIMQSKVASFAEALNTTVAYLVGLEEPTQPKKNASGMKYAKIREIRNQLERCRYVVMSAEAKIKRVEPLSQKFEQTVQLIQDTKEQVNNLVWQELRCKEELPAPMPATDMTVKLFRAMSKASWDQVRRLYLVAFAGMLADKQPEPEPYRDRTLVMLMHLEDQEAWKKIYTTVKTLTNEVFE